MFVKFSYFCQLFSLSPYISLDTFLLKYLLSEDSSPFVSLSGALFVSLSLTLPPRCLSMSRDHHINSNVRQVDPEATVLAFKLKISEQAGVSPELQRLIYKGRVMKDDHSTLASYSESASPPNLGSSPIMSVLPFCAVASPRPRAGAACANVRRRGL